MINTNPSFKIRQNQAAKPHKFNPLCFDFDDFDNRDKHNIKTRGRKNLKVDFNKKYDTIAVYCVLTFAVCLMLVVLCVKFSVVSSWIKDFFRVTAPVTWGIVIAYICNPIMKFFERNIRKLTDRKKPHPKLTRALSVALSMTLLVAILVGLLIIFIIQITESIEEILLSIPEYIRRIETFTVKFLGDYPEIVAAVESQLDTIQPKLMDYANDLMARISDLSLLGDLSNKVKDGALVLFDTVKGLSNFIIGFIVALYLLLSKETFVAQGRKITYALFPKNISKNILQVCSKANRTLSGFLSGKLLDSFIIGVICFIAMTIMQMDFVALISVIIGVTNMIPFFGPFFGAIPSAILLLMSAPKQVIPFIIFVIVLQQFDGNILGPKIIGDSTGLTPFWVMFAIFVGGGLFGFAGMLLGVPAFAVLYALFSEFIANLLKKKRLSHRTRDYHNLDVHNPPAADPPSKRTEEEAPPETDTSSAT